VRTIRGLSAKRNARAALDTLGAHFRLPCRIDAALICIILIVQADAALAHSRDGEAGLQAGFMHPLTGPDHLLAMVAVGMVSVVLGGAAIWRVPAAFLAAMLAGAMAGYAGWRVAHVEIGVAASVLLLGIALTLPSLVRWRHAVFGGVVLFGLCHGHAHEATVHHEAFTPAVVDEYLRTFAGREGVLGSMGIYRAAFTSIDQTEPLMKRKVTVPVVALGGEKGLGAKVGEMVMMVAEHVDTHVLKDCGHFMPEERPEEVIRRILALARKVSS